MTKEDTDNTVEQALLPCLFCSGKPEIYTDKNRYTTPRCTNCGCQLQYWPEETKPYALKAWNRRSDTAARELLALKEQIAAGNIAIVPVEPSTKTLLLGHEASWPLSLISDIDQLEPLKASYKEMLSATEAYNWEKGTFE